MKQIFLALLGPSGVGKSYIIDHLIKKDPEKYEYVKPYTTRELRENEDSKIKVTQQEFEHLVAMGEIFLPTTVYGNKYGPSRSTVQKAIKKEKIPLLDWPVQRSQKLKEELKSLEVITTYIFPSSLEELEERLNKDGRDKDGKRYDQGVEEIRNVQNNQYKGIDYKITNDSVEHAVSVIERIIRKETGG